MRPQTDSALVQLSSPAENLRSKQGLLLALREHPFVLAPMAAITDSPYRRLMKKWGAGIVVSELVSATGLFYGSEKTKDMMRFSAEEHPVGLQLFGEEPAHLALAARMAEEMGYDFLDLNCGCPVPKVVKKGAGSALLKDLSALRESIRALVRAVNIPVTIKIRTGWDHQSRNAHEVLQLAYDEGVTWVAVHGRTRAQAYEGKADWEYMAEVAAKVSIPVIGNGDIVTASGALKRLKQGPFAAVMIGRGVLKDPFLLAKAQELWSRGELSPRWNSVEPRLMWLRDLFTIFQASYDARIAEIQMKKLVTWMATGYPRAAEFRRRVYAHPGLSGLEDIVMSYFQGLIQDWILPEDNEGFLMGGHG